MLDNLPRPEGYENHTFPLKVEKPWGWEKWLELWENPETGRGYCVKLIFLRANEKSSLQYHQRKVETQYIINGRAEISLEDERGQIKKINLGTGEFLTVVSGKRHRVVALTDLTLLEVSTPEVDDVIRIHDNYDRQ